MKHLADADKLEIQERQYDFPYHLVPFSDASGALIEWRELRWAHEYMCYMLHVAELVRSLRPRSVLDIGCGDGRLLVELGPGVERLVGVDLSERAIRFARAFAPHAEFIAVDANSLSETFDVVVAVEVLEHVPDEAEAAFLRTVCERTRPAGHAISSASPRRTSPWAGSTSATTTWRASRGSSPPPGPRSGSSGRNTSAGTTACSSSCAGS